MRSHFHSNESILLDFPRSLCNCVDQTELYAIILTEIKCFDDPFIPSLFCFSRVRRKCWSVTNQMLYSCVELCMQEALVPVVDKIT